MKGARFAIAKIIDALLGRCDNHLLDCWSGSLLWGRQPTGTI
jgi:hypothetical protein